MTTKGLLLVALAICAVVSSARAEELPPLLTVTSAKGQISTAFAISSDGGRLAYVEMTSTAGRSIATLRVVTLPQGIEKARIEAIAVPKRLYWASATHVIVVEAVGSQERVWSVPIAGPPPTASLGPVDRADVVDVKGPTIVTYKKLTNKQTITHEIATYGPDLKPLQNASVAEVGGRVDHPDGKIQPIWWSDGSLTLVGRRPGAYDKAKDIRLPHQLVRLDVLSKTAIVSEIEPTGFARVTAEHAARQGEAAFVYSRGGIQLVSQGVTRTIALARPASDYYAGSLHYKRISGDRLLVSATSIRKSKDPDGIEFYVVDLASGAPRQLLVLPGRQRFVRWHAAGGRLAVLRLRQDARGGPSIDLHDLATN